MNINYHSFKNSLLIITTCLFSISSAFAQLNGFVLTPSGTTDNFMKYVPVGTVVNGDNYVSGYLSLSAFKNITTSQWYDPGQPVQKLQLQGGNILLCRTYEPSTSPDLNPTSRNGAILFSDNIQAAYGYTHGKWGIEYDDQYSTGGLNFFKPVSSLTPSRINFNLFLRNDGNVGIGTGEPIAKLQVADGDIFIQDIDRGIIMKSPDGKCWRGILNNLGQLQFSELPDCTFLSATDNKLPSNIAAINIYPNPVNNFLTIELSKFGNKNILLKVSNLAGESILAKTITGLKTYTMDVSVLPAGTYTLQAISKEISEAVKFVKQ
jgi:hypothetical protein